MKKKYISKLIAKQALTDFFLVKDLAIKEGSNGKQYLDLFLADKTGEIRAKKWNVSYEEADDLNGIHLGDILKVEATVTEWNGTRQLRVLQWRIADERDELDKRDFFKAAPEESAAMYDYVIKTADSVGDAYLKSLLSRILADNKERLMYWPAAKNNHHAEYGGLLWHIKRMLMTAEKLCEVYTMLNRDLLVTGVIIHDFQKLNEMEADEMGVVSEYTFKGVLLGHLVMGAIELEKLCDELAVSEIERLKNEIDVLEEQKKRLEEQNEELEDKKSEIEKKEKELEEKKVELKDAPKKFEEQKLMLEHMAISHHYEPEWGSPQRPMFPEAEALHYLDMMDAKFYDMEGALMSAQPGKFSEKVWTLNNRKVYKQSPWSKPSKPD